MYPGMLREIIIKFRKQIILFTVAILLIFLGVYIWNYLRYGTIEVISDGQNIITISEVRVGGAENRDVFSRSGTGSLSVRVSPGEYIISARGKVLAVNKTVTAEARKTKTYKLNPTEVSAIEPVAGINGNNLYADKARMIYVDSSSGRLSYIDSNNNIGEFGDSVNFQQVKWSEMGLGIGQGDARQLYTINSGLVKKLVLPKPITGTVAANFTISPGGSMYVSIGHDIYSVNGGKFTKIHTTDALSLQLIGADGGLAIINPPQSDFSESSPETDNPFVEIIDRKGESVAKKNIRGFSGLWSPDGSKLLVIDYFGTSAIYDKNLNLLGTLPNNKVEGAYWASDDEIVYAVSNEVWFYALNDSQSRVITRLEPGYAIKSIVVDKKAGYVYLAASSETKNGFYKLGLKGQTVPDYITTLDVFLPVNLDSCTIDYINFKSPAAILMSTTLKNKAVCKTQTEIELTQDGFNPADFKYIVNESEGD